MRMKSITAIAVLSLVVASLLVAGCTTTNTTNQTPSNQAVPSQAGKIEEYPKTGHSPLIQASIDKDESRLKSLYNSTFDVTWTNNTSAHYRATWTANNIFMTMDVTYTQFPTVQAASAYFDSLSSQYPTKPSGVMGGVGGAQYSTVTGHEPIVVKQLINEINNPPHYIVRYLTQEDALISQRSDDGVGINQA